MKITHFQKPQLKNKTLIIFFSEKDIILHNFLSYIVNQSLILVFLDWIILLVWFFLIWFDDKYF